MAEINDWSTSAASNNDPSPNGAPENMNPSGVNDTMRENMAVLSRWQKDTNGSIASTGSSNAYVVAANRTLSAYYDGLEVWFNANHANTGAATLNVDAVAAATIKKQNDQDLVSGDIKVGQKVGVIYDGTNWQMVSQVASDPTPPSASETVEGIVELATQAEVDAGTDTERVITPATLANYARLGFTGFRNVLINADFRINQRVYSSGSTLSAGSYGHDRWKAGSGGGDYTFTQLANSTQITIASGKTLIQVVEDKNVVGGDYILSWTGTAQARVGVDSATPSGSYASSPVTLSSQTAGTVMSVEFDDGTLSDVQLELNSETTDFEVRPIQTELSLCERYAELIGAGLVGATQGGTDVRFGVQYKTEKRANPTVSLVDTSVSVTVPNVASATSTGSTVSTVGAGVKGCDAIVNGFTGLGNTNPAISAQGTDFILAVSEL